LVVPLPLPLDVPWSLPREIVTVRAFVLPSTVSVDVVPPPRLFERPESADVKLPESDWPLPVVLFSLRWPPLELLAEEVVVVAPLSAVVDKWLMS
jgi:hypothetical protein